ncbi:NUDIX hydrolase [Candidatus Woesearchaeota archaeon]|nr:NUDIX hydrolase [Candidatus Woesearchaeota archaeon]
MPIPITPLVSVDCVVFKGDKLLLIKRKFEPFKKGYALPGGFVDVGETVEEACRREALEETGIKIKSLKLIGVYSDPKRDPRRHNISIAFLCLPRDFEIKAGDDALSAEFVDWRKVKLAFDHEKIINDALKIKNGK